MTYVILQEDDNGDLQNVLMFCSHWCASGFVREHEGFRRADITTCPFYEPGGHAYCEECRESVKHGANCFAALTNELTEECPEYKPPATG